jgi:hypothetical protein
MHRSRHFSAEPGPDLLSRGVQVPGAGVVPRSFPRLEDVGPVGGGERVDRREPLHEPLEVGDRLGDAGLLEEDLGDPDPVGVRGASPGKGATVGPEPAQERPGHRRRDRRNGTRPGARAHERPPEEESP